MVRNRSRRRSSATARAYREVEESEDIPTVDPPQPTVASQTHLNGNVFPSDEVIIYLQNISILIFLNFFSLEINGRN